VLKSPRSDVIVLVLTFALTVVIDLTVALEVGLMLSVLLFLRRMAMVTNIGMITREIDDDEREEGGISAIEVPGVEIYEINGPLFFGAAYKFEEAMNVVETTPSVRVLRMRNVNAIDATGLRALEEASRHMRRRGGHLIIAEIHAQPLIALERAELDVVIGRENIHGTLDAALARARDLAHSGRRRQGPRRGVHAMEAQTETERLPE
jgi:SulP family sulfate permease